MGKRRTFTAEFKRQAVAMIVEQGLSFAEVSKDLNVNQDCLRRWKAELEEAGESAFPGNGKLSREQAELRRLREENRQLKMERDILKKSDGLLSQRVVEVCVHSAAPWALASPCHVPSLARYSKRLLRLASSRRESCGKATSQACANDSAGVRDESGSLRKSSSSP
jgi:transposase